jgi:hypothetical protein
MKSGALTDSERSGMEAIKTFSDGSVLEYDRGKFDEWCVYLTGPDVPRHPPRDMDYFAQLKEFSRLYGLEKVYRDYERVYKLTRREVELSALEEISRIAATYGGDATTVDILLTVLYLAMIAEERKEHTRLGKRIKRLGIHRLLLEDADVHTAANFMRGMGWREIDRLCQERGF